MPLFKEHLGRSIAAAIAAIIAGHAVLQAIPHTLHALTLSQTSVAMLAISCLLVFVVLHHRRSGNVLTESQEEMILIGALGLFWFAVLVAWRAISQQAGVGITDENTTPKRRIETDVMKMLMSDYEVNLVNDSMQEFYVRFHGPTETPFAGGVWKIHVELPDQYPYKSPSIGFMNKIFHPNIDELSGSVCLDVINQTWSPMYQMINIFEVFLPQLLRYPNPNDPLNGEAAALLMRHPKEYDAKVKEYVQRFATKEAADHAAPGEEEETDEEMSEIGSISGDEV